MLGLSLFFTGFCCGHLLAPFTGSVCEETTQSMRPGNSTNGCHRQLIQQDAVLSRDDCVVIASELEKSVIQAHADSTTEPINSVHTYANLKNRIDRLPEVLIHKQLEQIIDQQYLESVDSPKLLAKKLVDIALADGDIRSLEMFAEESAVIEMEFSLSPSSGLRQFSRLTEIEQFDRIFTHLISSTDHRNLLARRQHRETGEILYFSSIQLSADQRVYISLRPQRGWLPGNYLVSLYDLSNNQKLVGSSDYLIASVLGVEDYVPQADNDVIKDLLSSGMAVPKGY
jgi:hypothetical protein